jgi:hypothetical protein
MGDFKMTKRLVAEDNLSSDVSFYYNKDDILNFLNETFYDEEENPNFEAFDLTWEQAKEHFEGCGYTITEDTF